MQSELPHNNKGNRELSDIVDKSLTDNKDNKIKKKRRCLLGPGLGVIYGVGAPILGGLVVLNRTNWMFGSGGLDPATTDMEKLALYSSLPSFLSMYPLLNKLPDTDISATAAFTILGIYQTLVWGGIGYGMQKAIRSVRNYFKT